MSVNYTDFDKIWASTSPLTPYEFSESQYKEGWNFVGATPPSRQMWDKFMQQADEKMQYLYNHESVPVGHEYFTFNPNIPQGSLPLFGGEYSRETYSALWNWVQEQTGYLKTEAEWQQLYTTNAGNVPFYSDGDGSTTFRVPSLKCWVKGANGTVSEVGSYLAAGLPNITAGVDFRGLGTGGESIFGGSNGAFVNVSPSDSYQNINTSTITGTNYARRLELDASRSSSIYGNSTTVQPPSIVGMWLVKAYGVVEDTGSIDEQQYIDDRFNASKQYTDDSVTDLKNTYLPANYISSSNGIDLSVFADYINFTAPSVTTNFSVYKGGYKKVGNIVYVHMKIKKSSEIAKGSWQVAGGLPTVKGFTDSYDFYPLDYLLFYGDSYAGLLCGAGVTGNGLLYVQCSDTLPATPTDRDDRCIIIHGFYYTD